MNNSTQPNTISHDQEQNNYGVLLFIVILVIIVIITIISILVSRMRRGAFLGRSWHREGYFAGEDGYGSSRRPSQSMSAMERGVDDATLNSYPRFVCSEPHKFATCCSICLGEYGGAEMLRQLPKCGHMFHQKCIDPWLKMHSTCPVCRSHSALSNPTEKLKPMVEVSA